MDIFSLPSYALKKPSWNFNFLHIFNIAASNRHETGCQMSARVFVALFDTIDLSWDCMKYHVAGFGNRNSIFRMKVVYNFGRSKQKINKTHLDRKKMSERNEKGMKINVLKSFGPILGRGCQAWQISTRRLGWAAWDPATSWSGLSEPWAPQFGRLFNPISTLFQSVEMGFYVDISWKSRCNIEINVWVHFYKILLVVEVLHQPRVKGMPRKN